MMEDMLEESRENLQKPLWDGVQEHRKAEGNCQGGSGTQPELPNVKLRS